MKRIFSFLLTICTMIFLSCVLLVGKDVLAQQQHVQPKSFLGSYLAGRHASGHHDTLEAARYMRRALDYDATNRRLMEQTFLLELMSGHWDSSRVLADKIIAVDSAHAFARLFRGIDQFKAGNYEAASAHFVASHSGELGGLISNIAQAWILSDKGQYEDAKKLLSQKSETDWVRDYQQYQRALIADVNGKVNDAQKAYSRLFRKYHQMVRLVSSYAQFLARNGQSKAALVVLKKHFSKAPYRHPDIEYLQKQIESRVPIVANVQNSKEGISEIFFSLGDRRAEKDGFDDGLIFLQLARYLKPGFSAADYALANLLYRAKKYDRAVVFLNNIEEIQPIWLDAQILKAQCLHAKDDSDAAIRLLSELVNSNQKIELYNALGKLYLDEKKFADATVQYTKAIDLLKKPTPRDWFYFYGRGISYERQKIWPKAEQDFKTALKLSPNRADVLNYLGYSWVDLKINLDKAMNLIRKAVKLKHNNGYYVDSLGWAHYQLGQYDKALQHLEKAVLLQPDDPVINDHLGDAYWWVGRKLEAKYQWSHVLSLNPDKELVEKINEKLKTGNIVNSKKASTDDGLMNGETDTSFYVVKEGESLWEIAKKIFGDGERYKDLLRLNPNLKGNPALIYPNLKLRVNNG